MKKILMLGITASLFIACNDSGTKTETTEQQAIATVEGQTYAVDSSSTITWTGSKPTGKHIGTFHVKQGSLTVNNNNLAAGNFTIDLNSLNNQDLASDPENKGKLEGHLKSPDFFDVQKYPEARFEITSIETYVADSAQTAIPGATHLVKGNLTLKDQTKNISFPARVTVDANTISASADFNIDRTDWGMNYKGPGNPQDWVISKTVNIKIALNATASK